MKKILVILGIVIVVAIAAMLFFGNGFGFGDGTGAGEGNDIQTEQNAIEENTSQDVVEENDAAEEATVTIVVTKSQYMIDDKEVTLSDIEALLSDEEAKNTTFILEDNYAAAKAWDELKSLFATYEISVIE